MKTIIVNLEEVGLNSYKIIVTEKCIPELQKMIVKGAPDDTFIDFKLKPLK